MSDSGFWDHAEALRKVILRGVGIVVGLMCVYFAVMPELFDKVILAPCRADFPLYSLLRHIGGPLEGDGKDIELINIQLASQFFIHMSTSLWIAVITAFPMLLYLIWSFVAPGLYEHEKRGIGPVIAGANVMFYLGVATGYFLVFPLTLRFLAGYQLSASIPNQISLDSYIDNFMMLVLVMGIVFQLPVVAWLLGRAGVLGREFFHTFRRHAIVALLIAAAVITPTGDPFTLTVVFLPLYILWEASSLTVPLKAPRQPSDQIKTTPS